MMGVRELIKERGNNIVIFNQFAEIGNPIWHYHLTGNAALEVFEKVKGPRSRMAGPPRAHSPSSSARRSSGVRGEASRQTASCPGWAKLCST